MATSNGILAAWPTAAAYLQGARPAPAPSSAGAGPADMESALEMSRYRATFRAKLKACQIEAALAGESTNPNKLFGKVNARMREMNQERCGGGESRILNSWNLSRSGHGPRANTRNKPDERKPKIRLDGPTRKRTGHARRPPSNGSAAKPSSAGAPGAAAALADTPTATATATVTPAVTSTVGPEGDKVMEGALDKSFRCELCSEAFNTNGGLKSHMARSHGYRKPVAAAIPDGITVCPACHKEFGTRRKLLDHCQYRAKRCCAALLGED